MIQVIKAFVSGLSEKEKKLLYASFAILLFMLLDRMIIGPVTERSSMLKREIASQMELTKQNIRILEYKDRIIARVQQYEDFFTPEELSRDERIGLFLSEVEAIAREAEVTLSNVDPVEVPPEQDMPVYSLLLEFSGKMENAVQFLHGIDSSKKPLRVDSFELSVTNAEEQSVRCTASVQRLIVSTKDIPMEYELPDTTPASVPAAESEFYLTDTISLD